MFAVWTVIFVVFVICSNNNLVNSSVENNRIEKFSNKHGECQLPRALLSEIHSYKPIVDDIIHQIVYGKYANDTWNSLATFVDRFGPRISGSKNLEDAIDYMVDQMNKAELDNVHTEDAPVTHWVRGSESAHLIKPFKRSLSILGLGSSVGTPKGGIMGKVIAVESFAEFHNFTDDQVRGKIVVFVPKWEGYGKTVIYRSQSASVASKKGAIAALVRSITPFSIGSPHTGNQNYEDTVRKIPTACLTVEDATMLLRMYRRGDPIQIHMEMEAKNYNNSISRNTVGELEGSVKVNSSVVVVSGHLDSWDVGVGAMDDGGGAFISFKAVEYLRKMNYIPKRTIRTILWTGEEQGYWGAHHYMEQHKSNEKEEFNFFIESDIGTFEPLGMDFSGNSDAECLFKSVLNLLKPMNATQFAKPIDGGPDISVWTDRGFPGASLLNKNEQYFWYHHSNGDSMLVEQPDNLNKATAIFAAVSYVIADISIDMPKDVN